MSIEHNDAAEGEATETIPPVEAHSSLPVPRKEDALLSRQERALRYLERKRIRQENNEQVEINEQASGTTPPPSTGDTPNTPEALPALKPMPDLPLIVPPLDNAAISTFYISQTSTQEEFWRRRRKLLLRYRSRKHMRDDRIRDRLIFARFWLVLGSIVFSLLLVFLSVTSAGAYVGYQFYSTTQQRYLTEIISLHDLLPRDNLKMYDRKGAMIGQLTDMGLHTTVHLDQISPYLVNATIATEDKNFWTNQGLDIPRIMQAALDDLHSGHIVAGGSTITQQLIKYLVVGNEATLTRKLQEVALTPAVNTNYSKRDILEMYLNSIYYGEQADGIDAAANVYFGLNDTSKKTAAQQLDLAQSVMLAGIPSSPYNNDPLRHHDIAFDRFQVVLSAMVSQGYISEPQALDAVKEAQSPHFFKRPTLRNRAPHFFNFVLTQLMQMYHIKRNQLSRSDMKVYTTLDLGLQDKIQKIAQQHVAELRDAHNLTNAAEVLIDYHTGAIISLLGSIDYYNKSIDGQFDVATQGYRQPGSSFKPYVYVTAFEQGASPAQAIDDAPLTINLPGGDPPTFSPQNYDLHYHGHMTLRCALQNSLNIPAVKVLQHVGISNAMQMAQSMGITSYEGTPGYSLVLGGLDVRLLDHTSAFGTFGNNGVHVPYYAIQKVEFMNTHQTYVHQSNPGQRIISPQLAYMMTSVLTDNTSRIPEFSDCNPLQLYSNSQESCYMGDRGMVRPAAAKTGTTTDFRDNWTMGYTTDYVMGVWAGNDNNTPMIDVSGVQGAAPIWHDSMLAAEQNRPVRNFTDPGGLERATVTYPDGVKTTDWFMPDTVPSFDFPPPTFPTIDGNRHNDQGAQNADAQALTRLDPPPHGKSQRSTPQPYCPSSYSFAFPPSSPKSAPGWW